jgi:tetratricopeptide (TPR) repeat protein
LAQSIRIRRYIQEFVGLLQRQGDLARAQSTQERALAIFEKVLGPEHLYTAICLHYLACLHLDQSDLPGARPLVERALPIFEKLLDPADPYTHWVRHSFARAKGDAVEALTCAEALLACCEKTVGENHRWTKFAAR